MNIYITKINEDFLKGLPTEQSMSGLVNDLLDDCRIARNVVGEKKIKEIFEPHVEVIKTKEDAVKRLQNHEYTGFIPKSFSARKKK